MKPTSERVREDFSKMLRATFEKIDSDELEELTEHYMSHFGKFDFNRIEDFDHSLHSAFNEFFSDEDWDEEEDYEYEFINDRMEQDYYAGIKTQQDFMGWN